MLQMRIKDCIEYSERKLMNGWMIADEKSVFLVLILSLALKFHKKSYLLQIMGEV